MRLYNLDILTFVLSSDKSFRKINLNNIIVIDKFKFQYEDNFQIVYHIWVLLRIFQDTAWPHLSLLCIILAEFLEIHPFHQFNMLCLFLLEYHQFFIKIFFARYIHFYISLTFNQIRIIYSQPIPYRKMIGRKSSKVLLTSDKKALNEPFQALNEPIQALNEPTQALITEKTDLFVGCVGWLEQVQIVSAGMQVMSAHLK